MIVFRQSLVFLIEIMYISSMGPNRVIGILLLIALIFMALYLILHQQEQYDRSIEVMEIINSRMEEHR